MAVKKLFALTPPVWIIAQDILEATMVLPLIVLLLSQLPPGGATGVIDQADVEVRTYVIDDSVWHRLRDAMRAARLETPDGQRWVVRSEWRYDWRWTKDDLGNCDPASARTDSTVILTVPVLDPAAKFAERDLQRWEPFLADLVGYERERIALVLEGRERTVDAMRMASDCASMEAAARSIHAETLQRIAAFDELNTPRRNRMVF